MTEPLTVLVVGFLGGLFLVMLITTTAFIKLSIVFFIIRNALGLQQAPSNMILNALAIILALYISMPVFTAVFEVIRATDAQLKSLQDWVDLLQASSKPIKAFLERNTEQEYRDYYLSATKGLWKNSGLTATKNDFIILIPAFMINELTRAFEIGFLLYLPFLAVDLVMTTILMAMGMMMVPPTIISVPFKLLLFILIGGWTNVIPGLILTYGG